MPFVIGLGAGIATGIFLSAEQGQRIRERAGKFAKQSADALKDQAAEALNTGAKALRQAARRA